MDDKQTWSQGYICAIATVISSHGIDTGLCEAWKAGLGDTAKTVYHLKDLGVDEYDISILKPHLYELNK